jgi:predicted dehydrogenase
VQLLKANGCRVLGFDPVPDKCQLARELGADAACHAGLEEAAAAFSDGRGADALIVTASTTSDEPINVAARVARMKGRVVLVGMVGMNIQRDLYYRKELDLRLSMSYGPGRYDPDYEERGRDYPFAYVRWTERRNMQAFLELVRDGRVTPRALVTHRFDIQEAAKAYDLISSGAEPYLGIVLTYPEDRAAPPVRRLEVRQPRHHGKPTKGGVGFIGAGNFARSVLLPHLQKIEGVRLTGVATATGLTCTRAAEKFGFAYATTDHHDLLRDPDTDTVFIVTRHDTHAPLVCEALAAGKNVFVEKPLAIDREQLDAVIEAAQASEGRLMVGFNRRFAPLVRAAKQALAGRAKPLVMLYRINAGPLPPESWISGEEGGGRIVGEVCHFIDTLQFLADARPVSVHAVQAEGHPDAASIQLAFEDGSIGTIVYSSLGDPSFPKEYLEVFGAGRVITIDDFRSARFVVDGRSTRRRLLRQDKGFEAEIRDWLTSVREARSPSVSLASLVATTEATFAVVASTHNGQPISLV